MNVYYELENLPAITNPVLTIGTFDGVHCGHQQIIARINILAESINGESVILTFHPHPRLVINPEDTSLKLLNMLEEKIFLLKKYGVKNLIVTPFSRQFSEMSAESYVKDFLWNKIHPQVIVIGYDHRFGKDREGGIHTFRQLSSELNFTVEEISQQSVEDIAVSSTKIRNALHAGNAELANQLLGHPYTLQGIVVKGEQIGKHLGFPTANIRIDDPHKLIPKEGVYAAKVFLKEREHDSMLYIGTRPTFRGKAQTIEVNIFDFNDNIYGEMLRVDFVANIRDDIKFDTADALKHQLQKDKDAAVMILKK
jgi:riboflavin kinase / FMN adenylyltransferase